MLTKSGTAMQEPFQVSSMAVRYFRHLCVRQALKPIFRRALQPVFLPVVQPALERWRQAAYGFPIYQILKFSSKKEKRGLHPREKKRTRRKEVYS